VSDKLDTANARGVFAEHDCRIYKQRIADLESQLAAERERVSQYEEGYKGSCYACEPVALRNISLEAELAECEIENNFLRADLSELKAESSR
jgi:hypothetical protein